MNAIISPLDAQHDQIVRELWDELAQEFGVRGVYITPYPHFSYQLAASYHLDRLIEVMQSVAAASEPFTVQTMGLGIFTGGSPVLYVDVVRSPELDRMHHRVWRQIAPLATGLIEYYRAEKWMPHITIGWGDMDPARLGPIVNLLKRRVFNWHIYVDRLAFIHNRDGEQELTHQFLLGQE